MMYYAAMEDAIRGRGYDPDSAVPQDVIDEASQYVQRSCRYRWIVDDGHGWLEVPRIEYMQSTYTASTYSHGDDWYVYLEEDADGPGYLRHEGLYDCHDVPAEYLPGWCYIRNLPRLQSEVEIGRPGIGVW
jgi:hypothetical protein